MLFESDVLIRKDSLVDVAPVNCYEGNVCRFYHFNVSEISPGVKSFKIEAKKNESLNYVDIEMVSLG